MQRISREELAMHFHCPISTAANMLGIGTTALKKICRQYGIPRWPHRKVNAISAVLRSTVLALLYSPFFQRPPFFPFAFVHSLRLLPSRKRSKIVKNYIIVPTHDEGNNSKAFVRKRSKNSLT